MPRPKLLKPNAILRREGLLKMEDGRVKSASVLAVAEGGTAMVYLTDPARARADHEKVVRLFRGAEGISAVLEPKDYPRYHLPQPTENAAMGDLVLAAKEGYAFSLDARGDDLVVANEMSSAGAHGYLSTEPKMNAVFVAAGAGIKRGYRLGTIDNIDVAPTIARLLGVTLEHATGRVLEEILDVPSAGATARAAQFDRDWRDQADEVRRASALVIRDPRANAKATTAPEIAPQRCPSHETSEPMRGMIPATRTPP